MATEIHTQIIINTPPEVVWNILTDFNNYPEWNPLILSLEGKAEAGAQLVVKFESMTFKPVVQIAEAPHRFEWLGHMKVKGLFDGRHSFQLEQNPDGSTTFTHSEKFTGILVPLFKKMLFNETKPGFEAMNEALKNRAETRFSQVSH